MRTHPRLASAVVLCLTATASLMTLAASTAAQETATAPASPPTSASGLLTMTIFLRHDESQTLDEINDGFHAMHEGKGIRTVVRY